MNTFRALPHRLGLLVATLLLLASGFAMTAPPAEALSSTVVISQVYGGGGNSGATLKNDFIELFNLGPTAVSLAGWSVQYAATNGSTWSRTNLSGTIAPGHYYLVQEAQGSGGTIDLPTPDATGSLAMAATAGKVVLVDNQTTIPIGTACPSGASIVDKVGYGTGTNCYEGLGPAPTASNTTADLRNSLGYAETDNNAADFSVGAPNPRNTSSPPSTPPAVTTQPLDQTVNDGQAVTFSASASGSPSPTVKWQDSLDGGAIWNDIPGATSSSLAFTAAAPQTGHRYRAVFTNAAGTATTNAVLLTVNAPPVVISQVYGGGGNVGATLKNDFIELFNRGTTTVSLAGWSVQYASSIGSTWFRTNLSGTIAPNHYYLIQEAQGAGGTTDLPTPDASGVITIDQARGKVVLVTNQTTILTGTVCPAGSSIVDKVGYGSGTNCYEGPGPAPTLSNTTAALRLGEGWVDTDDNAADFAAVAPNPRGSASPPNPGLPTAGIGSPAGSQTLTGASATISGTAIDLGGSVASVAVTIQRSSDASYWTGSTWSVTQTWLGANGTASWTYDWTFDPASQDGSPLYTIVARATDDVGNTGSTTVTGVIVDNTAPSGASISINGGAASTASRDVSLTLAAAGATEMRLSNDNITWSSWETYGASRSWTLSAGDGPKTVFVEYRDAAGNTARASDSITLDTVVPRIASIVIDGGAVSAPSREVTLTLYAAGAAEMRFSNDNVTWSSWEVRAAAKAWTLSAGDGEKTVFAQFRRAAGDILVASDSIILDTTAPSGASISIDGGVAYARSRDVTLASYAAGATEMRFSNDDLAWSGWEAYGASRSWTLSAGDGPKTVFVEYRDAAGNVASANDSIMLDAAAPSGRVWIAGAAVAVNKRAVTLGCKVNGAAQMRFSNDDLTWSGWEAYGASRSWTLGAGDGPKTVFAQFRDEAGNVLASSPTTLLDTRRPTPRGTKAVSVRRGEKATLRFRIDDPAPNAGTATVRIRVRTLGGRIVKTVTLKNRPVARALRYRFTCRLPKGDYRYFIRAIDAAGNRQTKVARNSLTVR